MATMINGKTRREVKTIACNNTLDVIVSALKVAYGDDKITFTANKKVAIEVGETVNTLGDIVPVCVEIEPTGKDYETYKASTKKGTVYPIFDRLKAGADYQNYLKEQEKKKAEKALAKEKKIELDEKARAEKA